MIFNGTDKNQSGQSSAPNELERRGAADVPPFPKQGIKDTKITVMKN